MDVWPHILVFPKDSTVPTMKNRFSESKNQFDIPLSKGDYRIHLQTEESIDGGILTRFVFNITFKSASDGKASAKPSAAPPNPTK